MSGLKWNSLLPCNPTKLSLDEGPPSIDFIVSDKKSQSDFSTFPFSAVRISLGLYVEGRFWIVGLLMLLRCGPPSLLMLLRCWQPFTSDAFKVWAPFTI